MINDIISKIFKGASLTTDDTALIAAYGQAGDYVGGIWGTLIGALTLIIVGATWYSTQRINEKTKKYQIFIEILRSHEEIVGSMRLGNLVGRDAFKAILGEFYSAYAAILKETPKMGNSLTLTDRIDIAFVFMYYGAHPETVNILGKTYFTFNAYQVFSELNKIKRSRQSARLDKLLQEEPNVSAAESEIWQASIRDGLEMLKELEIPLMEKKNLRDILLKSKHLPLKKFSKRYVVHLVDKLESVSEFGGHQNRLSNYLRNLYSAFTFLQDSGLTKKERHVLAKVLRSKLSNYEQALLAINSLTRQGSAWIDDKIIDEYYLIKNIPKFFFCFDDEFNLQKMFPNVQFEWMESRHR